MKRLLYLALLFLGAAILLSTGISIDSSRAADSNKITIAYSSNIRGYLEPCG
jgi:ABC-type phosphate transport system substrate-binding protein